MKGQEKILCFGEILWDLLPSGKKAGGAPFNVACHLKQLGHDVAFASRIGEDELGKNLLSVIRDYHLSDNLIQIDKKLKTGTVLVSFDKTNEPAYEITQPVAWDYIQLSKELKEAAHQAKVFVFGSLAQRNPETSTTIHELLSLPLLKVFDINLRPPFINKESIETSLRQTDILKLNTEELKQLSEWFKLSADPRQALSEMANQFHCQIICLTRGAEGAAVWYNGDWVEVRGIPVKVIDTVGAGDAFLAALISGFMIEKSLSEILTYANHLGAFVASRAGAIPRLDPAQISSL